MKNEDKVIKIGIISDTHGSLKPEVKEALKGCVAVLHAGDIGSSRRILDELCMEHSLYAVRGNNDGEWAANLAKTLRFTIGGVSFFMVHNRMQVERNLDGVDVVVFGHTHKYYEGLSADGRLWLNPGSCAGLRCQPVTLAIMTIQNAHYQVKKIQLSAL